MKPELEILNSEKISILLINCDGSPWSKDYIVEGENISVKTIKVIKSSYCTMRTIEVEPWHSDRPAIMGRIKEVFGNRQKTRVLQAYLYYNNKWYVFTYYF